MDSWTIRGTDMSPPNAQRRVQFESTLPDRKKVVQWMLDSVAANGSEHRIQAEAIPPHASCPRY